MIESDYQELRRELVNLLAAHTPEQEILNAMDTKWNEMVERNLINAFEEQKEKAENE